MNVVYSSDENYVQHMGVSILSLLETNQDVDEIRLFILANDVSEESKNDLEELVGRYNRKIEWVDFAPYRDKLVLNMEWPIALSAYARLFLVSMLPDTCQKVLYIDCDTVVTRSLRCLWEIELGNNSVAGVQDIVPKEFKWKIGLREDDLYLNSGVLLIDLQRWRKTAVEQRFISYIDEKQGQVTHHDQGVINAVLNGEKGVISPAYNAMTPFFTFNYKNLLCFYGLAQYYSKTEIEEACKNPVIIHYTPEFVGRVWEKVCTHPKAEIYRNWLEKTPWKDNLQDGVKQSRKLRVVYWMHKKLPVLLLRVLMRREKTDDQ